MTAAIAISHVNPGTFDLSTPSGVGAGVRRVVAAATEADRRAPLNEAAMLELRDRGLADSTLLVAGGTVAGFAWVHGPADAREVDLVVDPAARGAGVGSALLGAVLASVDGKFSAWSHGNHPAAAALAASHGLRRVRDLWVMRRPLDVPLPGLWHIDGIDVRTFRKGQDEDAWLALNAEAFAHHPEQGKMTRADLDQRMAEPWFDPAGFFVAEVAEVSTSSTSGNGPTRGNGSASGNGPASGNSPASGNGPGSGRATGGERVAGSPGSLVGFHWTKVHDEDPPYGEVYVVGVSPAAQGGGLGRLLTLTGLHHLASLGLPEVILYVESDNEPAVAVYTRLGFAHADEDTDVQYVRR